MKIFGLGIPELLIILVVILLIFGPKNLPKLGSAIGKGVKSLREGMNAGNKENQQNAEAVDDVVVENVAKIEQTDPDTASVNGTKTVRRVVKKKQTT